MRTRHILFLLAFTPMFFSCVKDTFESQSRPGDGTATRVTLSIKSDNLTKDDRQRGAIDALKALGTMTSLPGTRSLTPAQESLIANVYVLVFDENGVIHTNEHFPGLNITGSENISFETLSGNRRQIWVVANGDVNDDTDAGRNLDNDLKAVTTIEGLKNILVRVKGNGLDRTDRLTMVGTLTLDIAKPHTTAIPVQLHFLAAKATVTIRDNTPSDVSITIIGWDMVNIPVKTYLAERTGDDQADAVNPAQASDYLATNGKYAFSGTDATAKTWTQSVYLFENRRGGRVDRTDPANPADKYPGMSVDDDDQRGKAWYAPAGATYMLVYGTYTKDGQMNNVVYKIYLGENPVNDYNISRGKHYQYNVTINGLDNINIDTNVEWGSASFSAATSDNLTMDAHPDFRVLRIGGTAVDGSTPAYATVEVLETDGATPCSWLSVSPLNLYRHGIKQASGDHQQFAAGDGTGSYVRAKYTPAPTAESEFADATFSMTRKLTKIPFSQPAVYTYQNMIVYADAYDGTGERAAKIRMTYYKGADGTEQAGQLTYDITQSGTIKVSDDLYIERYEESAMLIHPGLPTGFQNTTTMQWGYSTAALYAASDRYTNGAYLTANAVYNNVDVRSGMDAPVWTAPAYADYREKYPRSGGKVVEPSSLAVADPTYFYPVQDASTPLTAYFHPIFNASAARYCHEKNRDTDGDGIISADETFWYLPSVADMVEIAAKKPAGLNLTGTYWTATEEGTDNGWAFTFTGATATPAAAAKTTPCRVRCVRGNGVAALPEASIESTETDKTKINLASTAKSSGAFSVADATGLPWKTTVTPSTATWLTIAAEPDGTGAAASATGIGAKTLYAYAATANTSTTAARAATVTLSRPGMPDKTITVTQPTPPSTVSPTSITLIFLAGESAAFTIDNKSTGLKWTAAVEAPAQSWLSIATTASGTGAAPSQSGTADATLFAYASLWNASTTTDRTATIKFSRSGMSDIYITVIQTKAPPEAKGWAGSNIYWDPNLRNSDGTKGRLTFDEEGVTTHALYPGVYFKFGSLYAISPSTLKVLYKPAESPQCDGYTSIPYISENMVLRDETIHVPLKLHDPLKGIGDICKHISDRGDGPGSSVQRKWRMPTKQESDSIRRTGGSPTISNAVPSDFGDKTVEGFHTTSVGRFPPTGVTNEGKSFDYPMYTCIWASNEYMPGHGVTIYGFIIQNAMCRMTWHNRYLGQPVRCVYY